MLALVLARPVALGVAFVWASLPRRQWVAAAWFGPKGFASVVYGLLVLEEGIPLADEVFHLVGLTVALSIVVSSSTDVVVARWFEEREEGSAPPEVGGAEEELVDGA